MMRELQSLTGTNQRWKGVSRRLAAHSSPRGQSLVEMALIAPVLLLMFIGVMEVGWALRGYLVLVNVDREAARFAARGIYLDFSQPDMEKVGYQLVLTHTMDSLAGQLPLDFTGDNPNATMIITHLQIDTGYPCSEAERPCDDECAANPNTSYPDDDVIILPPPIGAGYGGDPAVVISDTYRAQYGIGAPAHTTRVADTLWEGLRTQNEALNCQLMIKNPEISPSANSVIIVELFYDQPQLLGIPLISNRFTNPVPLYASTMMRIAAARQR
jgi:hypothetical protein